MTDTDYKLVTTEDIIAAAERNGYVQSTNGWFAHQNNYGGTIYGSKDDPIVEACFMGQIAINLEVDYRYISALFDELGLYTDIVQWNDGLKQSYSIILRKFKTRMKYIKFKERQMPKSTYVALTKKQLKAKNNGI